MTSLTDDLEEFEEQIRLQNAVITSVPNKTRVDPDGTVMEWDEQRKAWFPKIDDDFIARYQMSYGINLPDDAPSSAPTSSDPGETGPVDWNVFNAKLAKLREEKGDQSDEVQQLTKAANESLNAYYNSPAYREWYDAYLKQNSATVSKGTLKQVATRDPGPLAKPVAKTTTGTGASKLRYDLKPSDRMRNLLDIGGEDPDEALARAEAELQAGIHPQTELTAASEEVASTAAVQEPATDTTGPDGAGTQPDELLDKSDSTKSTQPIKRKQAAPPPAWYEIDESKNTHVYVTGLPPEITQQEFHDLMSKYGVIMNEPFTNQPRVKLYLDESGKPKGDGRCCYVKVESVDLVLKILDGMVYSPGYTLHVERAKFHPKGEFDPKKRRRLTQKEKKKLREQQENLFRWGIDTSKFVRSKKERVLVLKNAFIETDFLRDVTLIPVVRELLRVQCAKCGTVKKIVVHDANPLGVVTVTFGTPEEADTALLFLNKALFNYPGSGGARQLHVERWDGKTNYSVKEDKSEELSRISNWEEYLGGDSSSSSSSDDEDRTAAADSGCTEETSRPRSTRHQSEHAEPPKDYWEAESSPDRADTDDELEAAGGGGSSGNETA